MKCSLLVVTTTRLSLVERLFRSLGEQTHRNFEIIFVYEESCAAEAAALVETFKTTLDIKSLSVPKCGISRARNLGLSLLSGEIVSFPDDDCVYTPETLSEVVAIFCAAHHKVDALLAARAGLDEAIPASSGVKALGAVNRYALFGCSETFLQFYRSSCVQRVGSFDEKLGAGTGLPYGCGEDTDYALRAVQAGFTVLRSPSARVRHPSVDFSDQAMPTKVDTYACGRMYLLRKHSMPLWFRLANVVYPLAALAREVPRQGVRTVAYRWRMFSARLVHF
ncbi:MAG: glycosyltransferase [Desulfovibrio sp.]|jgi:GT2 family glycosyltransferase|nr:glycosyltransferase [Desulfovibrio sp.]